jgi:hypothetical protein
VVDLILSGAPLVACPTIMGDRTDLCTRERTAWTTMLTPKAGTRPRPTLPHRLIRGLDTALRRFYEVQEFSSQPMCLLRIPVGRSEDNVRLADGAEVLRGAAVLELHLWNEHLQNMPPHGASLGRMNALRRWTAVSLGELARYLASEPSLGRVEAMRARMAFVPTERESCCASPEQTVSTWQKPPPPTPLGGGCMISVRISSFVHWHGLSTLPRCAAIGCSECDANYGFRGAPSWRGTSTPRRPRVGTPE